MKNLSVGTRLAILVAISVLALTAIAAIGIRGISTMLGDLIEELYSHNLKDDRANRPDAMADERQPCPSHASAAT